jgi:hypothetical protein
VCREKADELGCRAGGMADGQDGHIIELDASRPTTQTANQFDSRRVCNGQTQARLHPSFPVRW